MNKAEIDTTLSQIALGDNDAFEKLYLETRKGVYAFLFTYFRDKTDCEDALQNVYLKIKMNITQYTIGTNGLAWILQIAKNTALNEIRKRSTAEKTLVDYTENASTNPYENMAIKYSLMSIMERLLDNEEQQIIILHVIWGYKHKEIAKLLNYPIGTITSKYKRAVDKIKKEYKEKKL